MAEYIDREAAINKIMGNIVHQDSHDVNLHNIGLRKAMSAIANLPAADVVEVRHGRWEQVEILHVEDLNEEDKNCILIASMFCPKCKRYHNEVYLYGSPTEMVRYCPNCGADMRGES